MRKLCSILCLGFFLGSTLAACRHQSSSTALNTPVLLWHSWNEEDTQVLNRILKNFSSIYPNITVIQQSLSPDLLLERFKTQAASGLGPDLLLLPDKIPQELIEKNLLREISLPDNELSIYFSAALETLRYHDKLYALPLSLHAHALYYNAEMVESPPNTLEELLQEALNGRRVALDINFYDAFWGVQAFGGTLFDSEGRVTLNQGGFTNWLNWLKSARNVPSMLLSNDSEMLQGAFIQGKTAYYTGSSRELPALQKALGENILRVTPLPAGPNDLSGPILEVEALLFNKASSQKQAEAALQLAQFLTNFEQQTEFVRKLGRIPANSGIWVDPKIYQAVAKFVEQSRSAVV
ncbi:MAG: extracellular solute-binding protein, partial [bacterium]|nr:extracellular solute-binding protein [bacterium]